MQSLAFCFQSRKRISLQEVVSLPNASRDLGHPVPQMPAKMRGKKKRAGIHDNKKTKVIYNIGLTSRSQGGEFGWETHTNLHVRTFCFDMIWSELVLHALAIILLYHQVCYAGWFADPIK